MAKKTSLKIKKIAKIAFAVLAIITMLLIALVYSIRFPAVQQFITDKAINYYQNKTNTQAGLERLYVDFPSNITLEGLYLEDINKDTLLYVDYLTVRTDLWELQNNKLHLSSVELSETTGYVTRKNNDSTFNFQFIVDAFSSEDNSQKDSTQSFDFSIGQVEISSFRGEYRDDWLGISTNANISSLSVSFKTFDLNEGTILIDQIALDGTKSKLYLNQPTGTSTNEVDSEATESEAFYISGNSISITNTSFHMEDSENQIKLHTDVNKLAIDIDSLDLDHAIYTAKSIELEDAFVSFDQFKKAGNSDKKQADPEVNGSYTDQLVAGAASLNARNTTFRYRDHSIAQVASGFNPGDLWLQNINLTLSESYMRSGDISGVIHQLSLSEKGGFNLNKANGEVFYSDNQASLKNFELKSRSSDLGGSISLNYPSLTALSENPEALTFSVDLRQSKVDLDDIYYFQPTLKEETSIPNSLKKVDVKLTSTGSLKDLDVNYFNIKAMNGTQLSFKGRIKQVLDINSINGKIDSINFITNKKDLTSVLGDSILPDNIMLPKDIRVKGNLSGSLKASNYNLALKTSSGNVSVKGNAELPQDSVLKYDAIVTTSKLHLGKILNQDQIGTFTSRLNLQGRGVSLDELSGKLIGEISSVDYNGYIYRQISLDADLSNQRLQTKLSIDDENLAFNFEGVIDSVDTSPIYKGNIDIERADFQAINLTEEDLKLRTKLSFDLDYKSMNELTGNLSVNDITFSKAGQVYSLDTIALAAQSNAEMAHLELQSSVLDVNFNGNFDFMSLPDVLLQHASRYFSVGRESLNKTYQLQQFDFSIDIKNPVFLSDILIPELESLNTGIIEGSYNSDSLKIKTTATIFEATYQGSSVDSLFLEIDSDSINLEFKTSIKKLTAAGFDFNNLEFIAKTDSNNRIKTDFKIFDEEREKRYQIGGSLGLQDSIYRFSLTENEFMLNYENWSVSEDNYVEFLGNDVWVKNLKLSKGGQEVKIHSKVVESKDSILTVLFKSFDLSFLGKGKDESTSILTGELNGNIDKYRESIKADIIAKHLGYKGDTLGTVNLQAENQSDYTELKATIEGRLNDVTIEGKIIENEKLDLNADFESIDIASLESLTVGALSEMKGSMNGKLKIGGSFTRPLINGRINFQETSFKINYLGSYYSINDGIDFTNSGLNFQNFTVKDGQGDELKLKGGIDTKDYQSYSFSLKLDASQFQLLDTDKSMNELIYGKLGITSTADITGTLAAPKIRTNLSIEPNSELTYVIPQSEIEIQNRKGVVEFFDADIEEDEFFGKTNLDVQDSSDTRWVKGLDLKANIDLVSSSVFHVVIDPVNKDQLTVSGDADLAYALKPDGSMTLTGRYEVSSGSYDLNFYGIAKRNFNIQPGSYLLWTGDPMNARMDVNATYEVRAVPTETDVSQKIPFIVNLNIGGELLQPDISFRLNLKERGGATSSVQSWLASVNQQESVLNKQVFSLLLFKSFLPTGSSSGNNNLAGTAARNSVSSILTNQLNKLGSRIKGLELSFDLESYETMNNSGETTGSTELELGLQKQFFNDRVVVKVAGNVDLEGERKTRQSASDFAGDIKVEYKLTEDGRFRLIGFRQNEYDDLLQGDVAKTGVGVIFVRDYNAFRELFSGKEKNKEKGNE